MQFLSLPAWKRSQQDCPTLRRVYSQLQQGSTPSPKDTKSTAVKHYLSVSPINRNGLLVVRRNPAFSPNLELIIIPQHILSGFVTALHLRFSHPAKTQLEKVFNRYFYAMGSHNVITDITRTCAHCSSLATLPPERPEYSTSTPPSSPGFRFASDVMRRERQFILVTRDDFSSFTTATILPRENKASLRDGLLETTAILRSGSGAAVRVDEASALQSLATDPALRKAGVTLEIGRSKCSNKNPIAEKAIRELEVEIKKLFPSGGQITQ